MNQAHCRVALMLIALPCLCGQQMTQPQEQPIDLAILQGPIVPADDARTLVNYDFNGSFERLRGRPEEAALVLLNLDEQTRTQVNAASEAYRHSLDMLLADQIDLIRDSTDAIRAGDTEKANAIAKELFFHFNPNHSRMVLGEAIVKLLPVDQAREFDRLLEEYWAAWIDWDLRNARNPTADARTQMEDRLVFVLFQDELREAYQRTLQPYAQRLELIYESAGLNLEQRATVRTIMLEYIRETKFSPTPEQRRAVSKRIYESLDEEGRISMFEMIVQQL